MNPYIRPLEKMLKDAENETVFTNPRERWATLFRKIRYRLAYGVDQAKRVFSGRPRRE